MRIKENAAELLKYVFIKFILNFINLYFIYNISIILFIKNF